MPAGNKKTQFQSAFFLIYLDTVLNILGFLEVDNIVRSAHGDVELPNVPIMSYVFPRLREGLKHWPADKDWIVSFNSTVLLERLHLKAIF
jgi:hypothetical protein